ncbi:MAG: glycosyltransferase family 4 protein [Candidatus Eisenbacteria bacterium]|uniref:Glycosyltransferase family 4 protein n=1 Tax=Eiseniibacteriota bacterium TaxID=2212470 RepID=A0A948RY33_UNCEI|nr:glycosyltransferase family 4 protein [Candidatus Eisenbacteria bacterium]MBU1947385.1 glycosyltransferase family 4 protein [Candidatus Eisenbacteria bacterium]MBU2693153.1 glycosyltransferase family 4 protein [Candidatus Eisenbacteria bacterium]
MPEHGTFIQIAHGADWGGTERHLLDLSTNLLQRGYPVKIILSHEGVTAVRVREQKIPLEIIRRSRIPLDYLFRLRETLRRLPPSLVHVHSGRLPALAARAAGVSAVVETRHGLGSRRAGADPPDSREGIREIVGGSWIDAIITVCRTDRDYLAAFRGEKANRVFHIPNGVARDEFPLKRCLSKPVCSPGNERAPLCIGYLGRLSEEKGLLHLLQALSEHSRPFHLEIAGTGPLEKELRAVTQSLDLTSRVRFIGFLDSIGRYISGWDLVALPSIWEGLPYAALEALGWGRPLLATRVGGLPDLIREGEWGWLAAPGDASSLGRALARIPWDRNHLRKMGEKGRQYLSLHFSLDQMVDRILDIYKEVMR